jgi:hypothetical protein
MTDLSALAAALKASFNQDAATRKAAQAALESGCAAPGALLSLMKLCTTAGIEADVAMASAVLFKNEVKKRWREQETSSTVSAGEMQVIRQNLIALICGCSSNLQPMFLESMRHICAEDYPAKWPTAPEECGAVYAAASFASPETFTAPLNCLLMLVKVFQFKPDHLRAPVEMMCPLVCPQLLQTLQQSLQQPFSPVIAKVQIVVAKILWSLTMFSLPTYFCSADTLNIWVQAMLVLSSVEPPPAVAALAPEDAWERCPIHAKIIFVC